MVDWLPGVLRLPADSAGGTQDRSYPPRLVLHTTEGGGTVQSLAAFYRGSTYWPHFTADIVHHELAQHLPFSQGGAALSHTTATETNNANCIQVEIIGRASESPGWPADEVDWLGRALGPVFDLLGIHRVAPAFVPGGAGFNAPQRMSEATWRAFNGVCGHQHVPENDHWDPGGFAVARFLAATHPEADIVMDKTTIQQMHDIVKQELTWEKVATAADIEEVQRHIGALGGKVGELHTELAAVSAKLDARP